MDMVTLPIAVQSSEMSSNEQFILYVFLIVAGLVIVFLLCKLGYHIKEVKFGPVTAIMEEPKQKTLPISAYRIAILKQPDNVSGHPAVLNTLNARVYDIHNRPLRDKTVTLSVAEHESETYKYISGNLEGITDSNGHVFFSDLEIQKRGSFSLIFRSDDVFAKSRPFSVTPPGLDMNPAGKSINSDEYIDMLTTAIYLNKGADKVTINGEEI